MSEYRDQGTDERTWIIALYLKGFTGLPKINLFNLCVVSMDFPFARDS
jgi:hypothetical protein